MLCVPMTIPKALGDRAFVKAGLTLWNDHSHDFRKTSSVKEFKNKIKHFCLERHFIKDIVFSYIVLTVFYIEAL